MTAADKIAEARALIEPLRATVLWQNANPNVMKAADLLAALADLADAQAQENAGLKVTIRALDLVLERSGYAPSSLAREAIRTALGDAP